MDNQCIGLNELPRELLWPIWQDSDIGRFPFSPQLLLVCTIWKNALYNAQEDLINKGLLSMKDIWWIKTQKQLFKYAKTHCNKITYLKLDNKAYGCFHIDDKYKEKIIGIFQNLITVDLTAYFISINACTSLATQQNLSSLTLKQDDLPPELPVISQDALGAIHRLTNLTSLHLHAHYITDEILANIAAISKLTSLHLICFDKITSEGLAKLSPLKLTSLQVYKSSSFKDKDLIALRDLTHLTDLHLSPCYDITNNNLAVIGHFTNLAALRLLGCYKMTNSGVPELAKLKNLTSLVLTGYTNITDDALPEIFKLTKLSHLDLSSPYNPCLAIPFTVKGLAEITQLTCLTSLSLSCLENDRVDLLSALQNKIKVLNLTYTVRR